MNVTGSKSIGARVKSGNCKLLHIGDSHTTNLAAAIARAFHPDKWNGMVGGSNGDARFWMNWGRGLESGAQSATGAVTVTGPSGNTTWAIADGGTLYTFNGIDGLNAGSGLLTTMTADTELFIRTNANRRMPRGDFLYDAIDRGITPRVDFIYATDNTGIDDGWFLSLVNDNTQTARYPVTAGTYIATLSVAMAFAKASISIPLTTNPASYAKAGFMLKSQYPGTTGKTLKIPFAPLVTTGEDDGLQYMNLGHQGWRTDDWIDTGKVPDAVLAAIATHYGCTDVMINLGANDTSHTKAVFKSQLSSLITRLRALMGSSIGIILVPDIEEIADEFDDGKLSSFRDAMEELSESLANVLFIDTYTAYGSWEYSWWADSSGTGESNNQDSDGIHTNSKGQIRWGQLIWQGIELANQAIADAAATASTSALPQLQTESFDMVRGDDYVVDIAMEDGASNWPSDLSAYTWATTAKGADDATATFSGAVTVVTPTGPGRMLRLTYQHDDTKDLAAGRYNFDIEGVLGDVHKTPARGLITLREDFTT